MIKMVDHNFLKSPKGVWPRPSIDLMKMANYLKQECPQEELYLITSLESLNPEDNIYYFGDMAIEEVPAILFRYKNVKFYGSNFEKIPKLAEHLPPINSIYKVELQERLANKKISETKALNFLNTIYYQAFDSQGNILPFPAFIKKKICICDEDFFVNEKCWKVLDQIIETRKPVSIAFSQKILCHDLSTFFKIRKEYPKILRTSKIVLDFYVPLHQILIYFKKYSNKLKGEINNSSNINIFIGKNYTNNAHGETFYIRNLYHSLNFIFSYYSRGIPISAIVWNDKEAILLYKEIYQKIASWTNSRDLYITLEEWFGRTKRGEKECSDFLEKHYVFKKFFNITKNELINNRGVWNVE